MLRLPKGLMPCVLALAILCLAFADKLAAQAKGKNANPTIIALAGGKGDPKVIAKGFDGEDVMRAFKPRDKRGIGVGAAAGAIKPDGIEAKLIVLGKKALEEDPLKKEAPALIQAAEITIAIGKINEFYTPTQKLPGKDPKDWKKLNDGMLKNSKDLIEAIKAADPAKVKAAAAKVNQICNECHSIFRDS